MFSKLLKHEFKSQAGLFSILSAAVLGAGLFGSIMLAISRNSIENLLNANDSDFLNMAGAFLPMMLMVMLMMAIVGYVYAVIILCHYRFYKRCFSDEGYLTFTLPVTSHQILLSSLVNTALWTVIALVVAVAAFALIMMSFFRAMQIFIGETFGEMFSMAYSELGVSYWLLYGLAALFSWAGGLVLPMLAITLGAVAVKKHKLLAGFGIYYGIHLIVSMFTGFLNIFTTFADAAVLAYTESFPVLLSMLLPGVLYLGIGIGGYFLMHYLVDEKLNLP